MLNDRYQEMYNALFNSSINRSTNNGRNKTTPKQDERKKISEIMIGYNCEYGNWFIKSFWETKKAFRYTAKTEQFDEWFEFMSELESRNNDSLFDLS